MNLAVSAPISHDLAPQVWNAWLGGGPGRKHYFLKKLKHKKYHKIMKNKNKYKT
jgi:hypothetical protein